MDDDGGARIISINEARSDGSLPSEVRALVGADGPHGPGCTCPWPREEADQRKESDEWADKLRKIDPELLRAMDEAPPGPLSFAMDQIRSGALTAYGMGVPQEIILLAARLMELSLRVMEEEGVPMGRQ